MIKQLNVEIDKDVINTSKSKAYANDKKLYEWVEEALKAKNCEDDRKLKNAQA